MAPTLIPGQWAIRLSPLGILFMGIALTFTPGSTVSPPLMVRLPTHLQPGVSTGMRLCPSEGMTFSYMVQRADEAMYQVKSSSKGHFALTSTRQ